MSQETEPRLCKTRVILTHPASLWVTGNRTEHHSCSLLNFSFACNGKCKQIFRNFGIFVAVLTFGVSYRFLKEEGEARVEGFQLLEQGECSVNVTGPGASSRRAAPLSASFYSPKGERLTLTK